MGTEVIRYTAVLGTSGWDAEWVRPSSPWGRYMAALHGWQPARPGFPFLWDGDLGGVPIPLFGSQHGWKAAGRALADYLDDIEGSSVVVAHSHGGQVALEALALGVQGVETLYLISTPVRKGIERDVLPKAAQHVGRIIHVHDGGRFGDWIAWAGSLFDGRFSGRRHFEHPTVAPVRLSGVGHSGVLTDPQHFKHWAEILAA